jgi:hypothetical protein
MRYKLIYLTIFFLTFTILSKSQDKSQSNDIIYRFERNDAIIFDYSNYDEYRLLNKHFDYEYKLPTTYEDDEFNRILYKSINFNVLSKNKEEGIVYFEDTISFPSNFTFEDGNFLVKNLISKNIGGDYNYNKYGLYFLTFTIRNSFTSDILMPVSIKVRNNYLIIKSRFSLYLYKFNLLPFDYEIKPYNDPFFAYRGNIDNANDPNIRFRPNLAYEQLNKYSLILETRTRYKDYFKNFIIDLKKIKTIN